MQVNSPQADVANPSVQSEVLKNNQFRISEVPADSGLLVGDAAVFNIAGHFCATQAKCPHKQGPLTEGKLDGSTVTYPWHGSQFDVCIGVMSQGSAVTQVEIYRVVVEGEVGRVEAI